MASTVEGPGAAVDAWQDPTATERPPSGRTRWPFWAPVVVLIVGLVVTGVLASISEDQYMRNEQRLLNLRARAVAAVLTASLPSIQTPLASATALANATGGNAAKFKQFVAPYTGQGRTFVSISLWRVATPGSGPLAVVGAAPIIGASTGRASAFFKTASASATLAVIGFLARPPLRLGYGFTGMTAGPFVAYGEGALPPDRYSPPQNNSAFTDINYALYLGRVTSPARLLIASAHRLPLRGPRTTIRVPFGDTRLAVTVAQRRSLGGSLPQRLPWIIALVGALLTAAAGALTLRLTQRRRDSEDLAARLAEAAEENRRLYAQQRNIAETLQHALLPDTLPQFPGLQVGARYEAGAEGVEVGGDWYDLIELEDHRLLLVVGDVSGRGLPAATAMAALRFAIHAYAAQGDDPSTLLSKLSRLLNVTEDRHLATVLCALIDPATREICLVSAGHLPLLMITPEGAKFIEAQVGLPVGIDRDPVYSSTTFTAPPGATLLAYTDGLVERRGESIDVGLERLRAQFNSNHVPLEQLLTRVLAELRHDAPDDTAIAGIRWVT